MKLKNKFIVIFLLVSLLPLVITSLIYLNRSEQTISTILKDQLRTNFENYKNQVNDKINIFKTELVPLTTLDVFKKRKNLSESEWTDGLKSSVGNYFINYVDYFSSINIYDYQKKKKYVFEKIVVSNEGLSPFLKVTELEGKKDFENVDHSLIYARGIDRVTGGYLFEINKYLIDDKENIWGNFSVKIKLSKILGEIFEKSVSKYKQYFLSYNKKGKNVFASLVEEGKSHTVFSAPFLEEIYQISVKGESELRAENGLWYVISSRDDIFGITYCYATLLEPYLSEIRSSSLIYFLLIILLAVILIISITMISGRMSSRINRVKLAAEKIARGDLETRIKPEIDDEIGKLSESVNEMAINLEKYIQNIKIMTKEVAEKEKLDELNKLKSRFISMTSHELKTPLTTIKWTLDNLLKGIYGNITPVQKEYLENLIKTSDHLVRTVENLLDLSKIEAGILNLNIRENNLDSIINEAIYFVRSTAEEREIEIISRKEGEDDFILSCDRDRMVHILRNILDNAVKYSPKGEAVHINSYKENDKVAVKITDKGPGIDEEEKSMIFTPFYNAKKTSIKSKGLGLGLSIVKTLVEYHKGKIEVESKKGKGSSFKLIFPLKG